MSEESLPAEEPTRVDRRIPESKAEERRGRKGSGSGGGGGGGLGGVGGGGGSEQNSGSDS